MDDAAVVAKLDQTWCARVTTDPRDPTLKNGPLA